MDVHQATIRGGDGCSWQAAHGMPAGETAATIVEFIQGLRGTLSLTVDKGILAAWLHDLLKLHVSRLS